VIASDLASDEVVVIELNQIHARPEVASLKHLGDQLDTGGILPVIAAAAAPATSGASEQPAVTVICDWTPPSLASDARKKRLEFFNHAMQPLIMCSPRELAGKGLWQKIVRCATDAGVSPNSIYAALTRFLQSGCRPGAFMPNWHLSGRKLGAVGKGRSSLNRTKPNGRFLLSVNDLKNLEEGAKTFLAGAATWEKAHDEMLKSSYPDHVRISDDGNTVVVPKQAGQRPSFWQFYRVGRRHLGTIGLYKAKHGKHAFKVNGRGRPGSQSASALQPGHEAELDWTFTDLVIVRKGNRTSIGRLVVYAVVDRYSGVIMSIHITMGTGCYEEAAQAVLGCLEDKVDLCARSGLTIKEHQWPVRHLMDSLIIDGGELDSWRATPLVQSLGINIVRCPSRRPDMKGSIESVMKDINYILLRKLPGATSGSRQRCADDPRVTAVMDFDEVQKAILAFTLLWNQRIRKHQPATAHMLASEVLPVPSKIWKWGEESGCLRSFDYDQAKMLLLTIEKVSITDSGAVFKKLRYTIPNYNPEDLSGLHADEWLATARNKRWKMDASIELSTVNHIWLRHTPKGKRPVMIKCHLAPGQEGYTDLTWLDYGNLKTEYAELLKAYQRNELGPLKADIGAFVDEVVANAVRKTKAQRQGLSAAEQIRNIGTNRAAEQGKASVPSEPSTPSIPPTTAGTQASFFDSAIWNATQFEEVSA